MPLAKVPIGLLIAGVIAISASAAIRAQPAASGPPAVGVVEATKRPITETSESSDGSRPPTGSTSSRASPPFLEKRLFNEGDEIKKETKLYRLERGPFEADLASKQALVAQLEATLENARLTTERARTLLSGLRVNNQPTTRHSPTSAASRPRCKPPRPRCNLPKSSRLYRYPLAHRWQDRPHSGNGR